MPPLKTAAIESPSPFTPLGTKGMGEGGGGGIHCIGAALQDALRAAGGAIVTDSHNPYHRVWELLRDPERSREKVEVKSVKLEGTKEFDAPREVVWSVINDPSKMAKTMPGVESFEIADDTHWSGEGQGAARARRPQDVDLVHEARGAAARVRVAECEGAGRRRADEHDDVLHALAARARRRR